MFDQWINKLIQQNIQKKGMDFNGVSKLLRIFSYLGWPLNFKAKKKIKRKKAENYFIESTHI